MTPNPNHKLQMRDEAQEEAREAARVEAQQAMREVRGIEGYWLGSLARVSYTQPKGFLFVVKDFPFEG